MPDQSEGIIETFARNNEIDLQTASPNDVLYIYALTFIEIYNRFQEEQVDFPEDSLQEIVDAFRTIFNFFNYMQSQPMDSLIANDIKIARDSLVKARSFADSAARIVRHIEIDSLKYYEVSPLYQQHLLNCSIYVNDINNQVAGWLQRE